MRQHEFGQKGGFLISLVLFIVFCIPSLTAADDARLVELKKGVEKEGKLVLYTVFAYDDAMYVVENFRKKYPFLKVELHRATNEQLFNRVSAEQKAKMYNADVITGKGTNLYLMRKMGFLSRYDSPERKFFTEGVKDKDGYWTTMFNTVLSAVYNTHMVVQREIPVTYQDLLKPQWKGRIGFNVNNVTWLEVVMKIMGNEEGIKYLESLAQQKPILRAGATLNIMLTAAGEFPLAVSVGVHLVEKQKAKGAPVEWARLKPYYGDLNAISMASNAPHPNAAKLFIDYVLSEEGQEVMVKLGNIPARKGSKSVIARPEEIIAIDPAFGEKLSYYQELTKRIFVEKKGSFMKKLE